MIPVTLRYVFILKEPKILKKQNKQSKENSIWDHKNTVAVCFNKTANDEYLQHVILTCL